MGIGFIKNYHKDITSRPLANPLGRIFKKLLTPPTTIKRRPVGGISGEELGNKSLFPNPLGPIFN